MSPESCFEKLEQLITDENRIVTYKILSREMKIHVNKAKEYLNLFYENKKSDHDAGLVAHYFLSGLMENEGTELLKILIIPEDKLKESKEAFQKLTSFHIYSVSRMRLKDECALYTTDMSYNRNSEELERFSAIKHPSIKIQTPSLKVDFAKTDAKNNESKNKNVSLGNGSLTSVPQKIENKNDKLVKVDSNVKVNNGSESTTSSDLKKKVTPESSKQNVLASLWQKKEDAKNVEKKVSKSDDKAKKGTVKNVGKNSIMNMFSKQAEKNVLSAKRNDFPTSPKEEIVSPKIEAVEKSPQTSLKKSESAVTKSSQKRKSSKRQHSKKTKHQSDDDSEEEVQLKKKKHRRICTFEDSDSESENEEMQDKTQRNFLNSPDEIFTSTVASDDSEEPIPPTPPVHNTVKIKGKVWKTVQKTYQDDDGFFVTKKEKELVTASEDSDEDPLKPVKKEPSRNSPSKTVSAAKKQASLTNYFNKK